VTYQPHYLPIFVFDLLSISHPDFRPFFFLQNPSSLCFVGSGNEAFPISPIGDSPSLSFNNFQFYRTPRPPVTKRYPPPLGRVLLRYLERHHIPSIPPTGCRYLTLDIFFFTLSFLINWFPDPLKKFPSQLQRKDPSLSFSRFLLSFNWLPSLELPPSHSLFFTPVYLKRVVLFAFPFPLFPWSPTASPPNESRHGPFFLFSFSRSNRTLESTGGSVMNWHSFSGSV